MTIDSRSSPYRADRSSSSLRFFGFSTVLPGISTLTLRLEIIIDSTTSRSSPSLTEGERKVAARLLQCQRFPLVYLQSIHYTRFEIRSTTFSLRFSPENPLHRISIHGFLAPIFSGDSITDFLKRIHYTGYEI